MSLPPFRLCASSAIQGEEMPWVGAVTGRAYLLYRSLVLYISTIFQDEKYRYNLTWRFIDWLAPHFKRLWPTIDPISNLIKRLYYEFSLEAGSMEFLWIQ